MAVFYTLKGVFLIWNYEDRLTSIELLNYYLTLAMRTSSIIFCTQIFIG